MNNFSGTRGILAPKDLTLRTASCQLCYEMKGSDLAGQDYVRRHVKPRHQWLRQLKLDNSSSNDAVAVLALVTV
jgi:hypothetical protein